MCIYGFQQKVPGGTASELSPGTERYIYESGSVKPVTDPSETGYIVEGAGNKGQIKDTNSTMEVTDSEEPGITTPKIDQQLGINTDPLTQQEWLKQQAQETTTANDELWKHFPEGGTTPGFADALPQKDPEESFLDNFINN